MKDTDNAFAEIVEEIREERKMSKTALAKLVWPELEDQPALMRYNRLIDGQIRLERTANFFR